MPELILTPTIRQALTTPGSGKKANYTSFTAHGKKQIESVLKEILEKDYSIFEYAWYFINNSLSNKNLALVFDCLKEKYQFTVTVPKSIKFNQPLPETMKAQIVFALVFVAHYETNNKTLLPSIIECIKERITIEEDAYFRMYKIIDQDNHSTTEQVDIKKLFQIQQNGNAYIAIFTYGGITVSGSGNSKKEARTTACTAWLDTQH